VHQTGPTHTTRVAVTVVPGVTGRLAQRGQSPRHTVGSPLGLGTLTVYMVRIFAIGDSLVLGDSRRESGLLVRDGLVLRCCG
jgi:hypothetical protein